MAKMHPGFTAIAILLGPAALIIGHQKITNYLSSPSRSRPDTVKVTQPIEISHVGEPAALILSRRVGP
jgi:hypothetical protein